MDVSEHYIQLRVNFPHVQDEQEVHTTIGELADLLCCTMRNMNLIMNKFKENGWVRWNPQRGRSKKSMLVFCVPLLEVARERFDHLLDGNRMEDAYELATTLPITMREHLMQQMQHQFGLRSNGGDRGRVDTLRIPRNIPFKTLDPTQTAMWGEVFIVAEVFDRLVRYNAEHQVCEPSLAVAWESHSEGSEWTFYLHKGIPFHHGRILDSEDVKFTFDRIISDKSNPCRPLFGSIERVETLDELTVRFVLNKPNFMFPDLMSSMSASILPRHVEMNPLHPIGTGPYRLTRHDSKLLVLEVFPSYFRGRAYIDRVEIWQLPHSGRVESVIKHNIFPDAEPRAVQHEMQGGMYMTFNMQKEGPQHDVNFRRAVQQLLNAQELSQALGSTNTQAAYSLIRGRVQQPLKVGSDQGEPWKQQSEQPDGSVTPVPELSVETSLARASALLRHSSYQGQSLSLWVEEGEKMEADMVWFAERSKQIGLHINIMQGDPIHAVYQDGFGDCDLIYTGEIFNDHVVLSLVTMYTFQNTLFLIAMNDHWRHELEQECGRVVMIQEPAERLSRLIRLEDRLIQEALLLPTYSFKEEHAHHDSLRDYRLAGYGLPDLRRLWVKRRPGAEEEDASYPVYIPLW
ncbi:ABC transporter substrate-binding protein [Paenibacillus sp. W2I17]|uniref:ABC transporter substrate-binding protein n=1 Tax=Paenibacillus sp. W2I17 TaxID=3042311 RepID=UPI00277E6F90|nr:ABC transporter substrate-binding protein [Paenibacillus sp. W2I17]MDQ0658008.1 MarR-like DNA-binding transcriptional regulator SgrR of sgrS sRNA [Paenibacillus sp. W2I17]